MKTRAEAEQALDRDPVNVAPDTRAAIVAVHGEAKFKEMRHAAIARQAANIRVTARPEYVAPQAPAQQAPAPAAAPQFATYDEQIDHWLATNPMRMPAEVRTMHDRLRGPEVARSERLRAVERTGQSHTRVTNDRSTPTSTVRSYSGEQRRK